MEMDEDSCFFGDGGALATFHRKSRCLRIPVGCGVNNTNGNHHVRCMLHPLFIFITKNYRHVPEGIVPKRNCVYYCRRNIMIEFDNNKKCNSILILDPGRSLNIVSDERSRTKYECALLSNFRLLLRDNAIMVQGRLKE
ncbi:uncharacterized protein LOC132945345 [Metopolophium dirhodum]|uniref:uncharacterized protein LOC132945345 n=1 Tax=Metopolophium dirhodum TaxID=44670 RepID=UPI0029900CAB|nr:uncharacterized protein LOC132945345 [Metopolophium dirhodum]